MDFYEIIAWMFLALITVLRIALVVGLVFLMVMIVKGVCAYRVTPPLS